MPKHSILIVDDESSIRNAFCLLLSAEGYEIDTAENGQEGLEKLRKHNFDLLLLDLKMPVMGGVEVLEALDQEKLSVPIFIVTAYSGEFSDKLNALSEKGLQFDILHKPIDRKELLLSIKSVFEGPQVH